MTFNSDRYIRRCLETLLRQDGIALEVVVFDNASTDRTRKILKEFKGRIRILASDRNVGFAEGQNRAIQASTADWVLTLNPDVLLAPDFLRRLVEAGESDALVGTVCGKLLSIGPGFEPLADDRIDSTGIFFTPAMRHFDRGWHEPDGKAADRMEYVFGASAAAALFRRRMIDDIAIEGKFFDPDFFVYREDADVAWRAQLLGWRCLYTPAAVGRHVRTVTPANRRSLPAMINMHSVKNRFLMRVKNTTPGVARRCWAPMLARDLIVLGGSLLWEPRSLRAFWEVGRALPRALRQRREIMRRRRASDAELAQWFSFEPMALPVAAVSSPAGSAARTRPSENRPRPASAPVSAPTAPEWL